MATTKKVKHSNSCVPNPNYPEATSSGLPSGSVKYYRQARKCARVYTVKDVARISKTVSDSTNPYLVAGVVLLTLGFGGYGLCRLAKAIKRILSVWSLFLDVGFLLALSQTIEVILDKLGRVRIPVLRRMVIGLVVVFGLLRGFLGELKTLSEDVQLVSSFADNVSSMCEALKNSTGELGQWFDDLVSELPDTAEDISDSLKDKLNEIKDALDNLGDQISN